jgi:hypothetical protein
MTDDRPRPGPDGFPGCLLLLPGLALDALRRLFWRILHEPIRSDGPES